MTYAIDIARCNATLAVKNILSSLAADLIGPAGGDLSGLFPNPTVAKINGVALGSTTATAGNILIGSGTAWVTNPISGDFTINSTGIGTIANLAVTNAKIANSTIDLTAKVTGILANANTTATNANTLSAIVARDGSGNFSAGTITAALTGNASTATALQNARTIGGVSFNGTANITVASATGGFTVSGGTLSAEAISSTGNTTFSSTGQRILGDFTNATRANRLLFQTTTTAGQTSVGALPAASGGGSLASFVAYGLADPDNTSQTQLFTDEGLQVGGINSRHTGTGTTRPIVFQIDSVTQVSIATNGTFTLGTNSISCTGSLGATGARLTSGWFTDLTVTNAISGSITGNAATATKLATGRTIAITGDLTYTSPSFDGSGNVTAAGTLATVNTNVGTFGTATQSAAVAVNGKGLITAVSNITITPAVGSITGLGTGIATALAVNTGSAGAPVLFNGAGGTPSSLTLTSATGLPLTTGVTGILPVANGGTNAGAFTAGSVVFAGTSGTYTQKNANFFWDNTNNRLGIGTITPSFNIEVVGSIAATIAGAGATQKQMVIAYDSVNDLGSITAIHQGIAFTPIQLNGQCVYIVNGSAPGTPTGQYALYSLSGALKGKGTSGTVTNIGNAEPHCPKCGSDFGVGWENPLYGGQMIVCKVCETDYLENLRKCLNYIVKNDQTALSEMGVFLSTELSHVRWNPDRNDEYQNVKIPPEIGVQMANNIATQGE